MLPNEPKKFLGRLAAPVRVFDGDLIHVGVVERASGLSDVFAHAHAALEHGSRLEGHTAADADCRIEFRYLDLIICLEKKVVGPSWTLDRPSKIDTDHKRIADEPRSRHVRIGGEPSRTTDDAREPLITLLYGVSAGETDFPRDVDRYGAT